MNRNILFVVTTLLLVWIFQTLFVFLVPSAFPTPHWLLLATLAFGLRNSTRLAMTAFGTQGWLLMLAGAAAGLSARELNADKLITQITVAALGTVVLFGGAMVLRGFFLQTVPMVAPGLGHLVIGVILNACAAPAVFWAQSVWISAWRAPVQGDHE